MWSISCSLIYGFLIIKCWASLQIFREMSTRILFRFPHGLFFYCWIVSILFTAWCSVSYQAYDLQVFFFYSVDFLWWHLFAQKFLTLLKFNFFYSFLIVSNKLLPTQSCKDLFLCFLLRVLYIYLLFLILWSILANFCILHETDPNSFSLSSSFPSSFPSFLLHVYSHFFPLPPMENNIFPH